MTAPKRYNSSCLTSRWGQQPTLETTSTTAACSATTPGALGRRPNPPNLQQRQQLTHRETRQHTRRQHSRPLARRPTQPQLGDTKQPKTCPPTPRGNQKVQTAKAVQPMYSSSTGLPNPARRRVKTEQNYVCLAIYEHSQVINKNGWPKHYSNS